MFEITSFRLKHCLNKIFKIMFYYRFTCLSENDIISIVFVTLVPMLFVRKEGTLSQKEIKKKGVKIGEVRLPNICGTITTHHPNSHLVVLKLLEN